MSEAEDDGEATPRLPKITLTHAALFLLAVLTVVFTGCCAAPSFYFMYTWDK
jgi:hypothetical protein